MADYLIYGEDFKEEGRPVLDREQPVELKEKIRQYARELRRRSLRPNDR